MAVGKTRARIFAETYVEEGFNGSAAIRKLNPKIKDKNYITVKASRTLASAKTQQSLREVLTERGFDDDSVRKLLHRNASQNKNLPASNTALDMVLKVRGDYAPEKRMNVNMNIKSETDADELISRLKAELDELSIKPDEKSPV